MSILESIFLGILQGLTEFIPVSSSGHLVLLEDFLKLPVHDLKSFDITLHIGTLAALLIYFWKDFYKLICAFLALFFKKIKMDAEEKKDYQKLLFYLIIATLPALIIGILAEDFLDSIFRNITSVAIMMGIVGIFFLIAEMKKFQKQIEINSWKKSLIIGFAQALALIPGVSRSGATISISLILGIKRINAARFSFLLGSIAIFGAGFLSIIGGNEGFNEKISIYILGFISSFLSGFLAIFFMMKFLKNNTLKIFAYYRIIFSIIILSAIFLTK